MKHQTKKQQRNRSRRFQRTIRGFGLLVAINAIILTFFLSYPNSALADYVGTSINRIFVDPGSISTVIDGYDTNDIVSFIVETTVADTGSVIGIAAWTTVYIPAGVEVTNAEIVWPDGSGGYTAIPAPGPSITWNDCGVRGCGAIVPNGGTAIVDAGSVSDVNHDTGIFYSTDSRTALSGPYLVDPTGTATTQLAYNQWDRDQVLAFGDNAALFNNGKGNTPLVSADGTGTTWAGTGSPIAGPYAYYTNDYDPACDGNAGTPTNDDLTCTGPWQRISYSAGKVANSATPAPYTSGGTVGPAFLGVTADSYAHSFTSGSLPSGANAVRFVLGERVLGDQEYVRITFKITDSALFTASLQNDTFCADSTGGDTTSKDGIDLTNGGKYGKDNPWRYYEGNNHKCFDGNADVLLLKSTTAVNGVAGSGTALAVGDIVSYKIEIYNTSSSAQTNLFITDTAATNLALVSAGTAGCSYSSYNGSDAGAPAFTGFNTGNTEAYWANYPSLAAGASITVYMCGQVNSGLVAGNTVENRGVLSYDTAVLTSTVKGTIANLISGNVYYDPEGDGGPDPSDTGLSGVTVCLYVDNGTTDVFDAADTQWGCTVTGPDGSYQFTGMPDDNGGTPIEYLIVETDSNGMSSTEDSDTAAGACAAGALANSCNVIPLTGEAAGTPISSTGNDFWDTGAGLDYGDLPASYSITTLLFDGARHSNIAPSPQLGTLGDFEINGQPTNNSTGDGVDEDGVARDTNTLWSNGATININLDVQGGGTTADAGMWIDWDGDGVFQADEFYTFLNLTVGAINTVSLTVPGAADYTVGNRVNVRVRLFASAASAPGGTLDYLDYLGYSPNGEVEDYQWDFGPTAINLETLTVRSSGNNILLIVTALLLAGLSLGSIVLRKRRREV